MCLAPRALEPQISAPAPPAHPSTLASAEWGLSHEMPPVGGPTKPRLARSLGCLLSPGTLALPPSSWWPRPPPAVHEPRSHLGYPSIGRPVVGLATSGVPDYWIGAPGGCRQYAEDHFIVRGSRVSVLVHCRPIVRQYHHSIVFSAVLRSSFTAVCLVSLTSSVAYRFCIILVYFRVTSFRLSCRTTRLPFTACPASTMYVVPP